MGVNLLHGLSLLADTSGAVSVMRGYVNPMAQVLAGLATLACVFFLVNGGYQYITSTGNPEALENAKLIIKRALIGLVIVLGAATLTTILSGAYGDPSGTTNATLPSLQAIEPDDVGSGLVEVLIKAITGFLNNIIQAVGAPFLSALDYFTKETPLMAKNSGVFNLWLAVVGITDVLFILVVALLGFHVMSSATLGFDELDLKQLLPRLALAFLLINTSIFFIDAVVELSNVLITAINKVSGASSVWETLTAVVKESGGQGAAALLVMVAFLIFSVILLIYYVGRLVVLFLGAVLSPLVVVLWLLPSFRDFAVSAIKTYITTIFVLFVHVVTLILAATLFTGMSAIDGGNTAPNVLMSMVVGLATVLTLLKTQGVMMQFSYVSMGARNARKLGGQFINGVSHLTSIGKGGSSRASHKKPVDGWQNTGQRPHGGYQASGGRGNQTTTRTNASTKNTQTNQQQKARHKTGTTVEAPPATSRNDAIRQSMDKSAHNKEAKS
ncbi:hypothetical protein E6P97_00980 [Patescibacteria group bacterium]|nr:MAG: hypothetical protein E6P97_00980 [Patescibacteria group bacterium]